LDELVIGIGDEFAARWVQEYVDSRTAVAEALRTANAVAVVFAADDRAGADGDDFFGAVQAALRATEAAVPAGKRALFIAVVLGGDARESRAFAICGDERTGTGTCPPLVCARGVFLGYILLGEGGALFSDGCGDTRGVYPKPDYVLGRIRSL